MNDWDPTGYYTRKLETRRHEPAIVGGCVVAMILIAILAILFPPSANAAEFIIIKPIPGETQSSVADDLQKVIVLCAHDTDDSALFEKAYVKYVSTHGTSKGLHDKILRKARVLTLDIEEFDRNKWKQKHKMQRYDSAIKVQGIQF